MIAYTAIVRRLKPLRLGLLLVLCAALLPLAACKKKEDAAAAAAPADEPPAGEQAPKEEPAVELKPKWPAGRRAVVRIERSVEMEPATATASAQPPVKMEAMLAIEMAFKTLKEREGGGSEVEAEFLHVNIASRSGGKPTGEFDTRTSDPKADGKNQASALRRLVGSRVKYQFAADGKAEKVEGVALVFQKIAPASLSPLSRPVVPNFATEDAFKSLSTLTAGLPTAAVKPGDAWETTAELPYGPFILSFTGTNTLKGWETKDNRRLAMIETTGTVAMKGGGAGTLTISEGATASGQFGFDPALGCAPEGHLNWKFTVNIAQATGQSVTKVQVKQTSKITDINEPAAAEAAPSAPDAAAKPADAKPAKKPKTAEKP